MKIYSGVSFECVPAERYDIPPDADRFYFFNPFSIAPVRKVVSHIRVSCLEHPRDALLIFYFPVDDLSFLQDEGFTLTAEIDCNDLFHTKDPREKICVYQFTETC